MNAVGKALWYIEAHQSGELTLDEIARQSGVSRFHLARAFAIATGVPVMRYARGRRLSTAAIALRNGAPDILTVALEAGYGSHEAFSRAFREEFDITPEALRALANFDTIQPMEPIQMNHTHLTHVDAPRFQEQSAMVLAGLNERYNGQGAAGIPSQWQRFTPWIGHVPGQIGQESYGVCHNGEAEGEFDYLCGVPILPSAEVPPDLFRLKVPAQRYAVFEHKGHISEIRGTWNAIFSKALPEAGLERSDAPDFERYDHRFNPATGQGTVEIWIPVNR